MIQNHENSKPCLRPKSQKVFEEEIKVTVYTNLQWVLAELKFIPFGGLRRQIYMPSKSHLRQILRAAYVQNGRSTLRLQAQATRFLAYKSQCSVGRRAEMAERKVGPCLLWLRMI